MKEIFLIAPFFVTACVVAPYNHQPGGAPGTPIEVSGFAVTANEPVEIQALDHSDEDWVTVGNATSSAEVTWTIDDVDLYAYSDTVTLNYTSFDTDNCFYGYSPVAGCIAEGYPQLRVYQPNPGATYFTFEQDGLSCVLTDVAGGDSLLTAVNNCKSPDTPVITMSWVW